MTPQQLRACVRALKVRNQRLQQALVKVSAEARDRRMEKKWWKDRAIMAENLLQEHGFALSSEKTGWYSR